MTNPLTTIAGALFASLTIGLPIALPSLGGGDRDRSEIEHTVLISVDGMHQSDLDWYVANHPGSELAKLAGGGAEYSNAHTAVPSDSDPGGTALMTGGDPRATGVYYDVEYNHNLYEAGTTSCHGQPTGADVIYDSPDDLDVTRLDAGQGLTGLPGSILQMTGQPQTLLNPATFPVDPTTCQPIAPHSYLKVNTIFEVAHDAGLRTAWSDKHPVYESFNGPSGTGIDDLFAPEIDSTALSPTGPPTRATSPGPTTTPRRGSTTPTRCRRCSTRSTAIDHSGTTRVGVPAIFGMNFQTVSTAEKLPQSEAVLGGPVLAGGYLPGTTTPGPLLSSALDYVNAQLQAMDQQIQAQGIGDQTAIILTAKHGQSPQDPNQLTRIKDGPIIDAINAAWTAGAPGRRQADRRRHRRRPVAELPVGPLAGRRPSSSRTSCGAIRRRASPADGGSRTLEHSGLAQIYAGRAAAAILRRAGLGPPPSRRVRSRPGRRGLHRAGRRSPSTAATTRPTGACRSSSTHPGPRRRPRSARSVETTQVAPTILRLLGLRPARAPGRPDRGYAGPTRDSLTQARHRRGVILSADGGPPAACRPQRRDAKRRRE